MRVRPPDSLFRLFMSLVFSHFDSDRYAYGMGISSIASAMVFSFSRQIGPQNPFVSITITDTLLTKFYRTRASH